MAREADKLSCHITFQVVLFVDFSTALFKQTSYQADFFFLYKNMFSILSALSSWRAPPFKSRCRTVKSIKTKAYTK